MLAFFKGKTMKNQNRLSQFKENTPMFSQLNSLQEERKWLN